MRKSAARKRGEFRGTRLSVQDFTPVTVENSSIGRDFKAFWPKRRARQRTPLPESPISSSPANNFLTDLGERSPRLMAVVVTRTAQRPCPGVLRAARDRPSPQPGKILKPPDNLLLSSVCSAPLCWRITARVSSVPPASVVLPCRTQCPGKAPPPYRGKELVGTLSVNSSFGRPVLAQGFLGEAQSPKGVECARHRYLQPLQQPRPVFPLAAAILTMPCFARASAWVFSCDLQHACMECNVADLPAGSPCRSRNVHRCQTSFAGSAPICAARVAHVLVGHAGQLTAAHIAKLRAVKGETLNLSPIKECLAR